MWFRLVWFICFSLLGPEVAKVEILAREASSWRTRLSFCPMRQLAANCLVIEHQQLHLSVCYNSAPGGEFL